MAADSGGARAQLNRLRLGLSTLVAFAGAFALFVVQPLLAKWLLPALGGSPATWVTCMLFFQSLLVGGYAAAHLATRSEPLRVAYCLLVVIAPAAVVWNRSLPLSAADVADADAFERAPVWHLLVVLLQRVGLPYLLLSTVAPLVQRWAAGYPERSVIRLYAVSNAGSLAALLAYPVLIEPGAALPTQWLVWSWATVILCGLVLVLALTSKHSAWKEPREKERAADGLHGGIAVRCRWLAYSFVPSVFLLATTSYLTTDIAAVPLLWIVPLALYLLTFIAAFGGAGPRTYRIAIVLFVLASLCSGWNAFAQGSASLWQQLGTSLAALSFGALLCHMELVRSRPSIQHLTEFYVWISVGGALGGFFVAVLAPLIFNDYYELELATLATYVALLARPPALSANTADAHAVGRPRRSGQRALVWFGVATCLPMLVTSLWLRAHGAGRQGHVLDQRRSFLGAVRVTQLDVGRSLTHGRIRHGMQLDRPDLRRIPTMYFGEGTAIAQVFARHHAGRPRSIGVVGLGAGTLAVYGTSLDRIRFYELDPQVVDVASHWFTFLRDSPARITTWLGDGRLGLARDTSARFDILVLDAFTSDAVPVHLLTLEAFRLYSARLAPDGVLLLNVSNRHLAVDRVVRGAARAQGLACVVIETPANPARFVSKVRWAVVARQREQLSGLVEGMNRMTDPFSGVVWTDAHASLWPVLR
ncbi:MAG TPA: fused MFS/spermidine synthase [Polyangiales bacterium]|nr:fused MFS/spermidine synthase [Polyangiales bacterium]